MAWVATGTAVVGTAATLIGSSQAADKAAAGQKDAINAANTQSANAIQAQQEGYEEALRRGTPYEGLGQEGAYRIASAISGKGYTYADPNYEILPETEAREYRTTALYDTAAQALYDRLKAARDAGQDPVLHDSKYGSDIKLSKIWPQIESMVVSGKSISEAMRTAKYGDLNLGGALTQAINNYQKDPASGFNLPLYRTNLDLTDVANQVISADQYTQNVYRNRLTGEVTTKPQTTTVNEKPFEEATIPEYQKYNKQYIEPDQYTPYNYQRTALPQFGEVPGAQLPGSDAYFNDLQKLNAAEIEAKYGGGIPINEGLYDRIQQESASTDNPYVQAAMREQQRANERLATKGGLYFNPRARAELEEKTTNQIMYNQLDRQRADAAAKYGALVSQNEAAYGREKGINELLFEQAVRQYGMDVDVAAKQFGIDLEAYQQGAQNQLNTYQMGVSAEDAARNRAVEDYKMQEARNAVLRSLEADKYATNLQDYNVALGKYGLQKDQENTRYQRLLDLTKIGQGQSSQAGQWATATGANIANIQQNTGNTLSNLYQSGGNTQAQIAGDMWSGIGTSVTNAGNLYAALNKPAPQTPYALDPQGNASMGPWATPINK